MYCEFCDCEVEARNGVCPSCGSRLDGGAEKKKSKSTRGAYETHSKNGAKRGGADAGLLRLNLSKPLALVFAALMIASFFAPWLTVSAQIGGMKLLDDVGLPVFRLQPFFKGTVDTVIRYVGQGAKLTAEGEDALFAANGVLLLIEAYFMIVLINFLLFGIIGAFTRGRAKYFFLRVGSTMYFIGLVLMIVLAFVLSGTLGNFVSRFSGNGGLAVTAALAPSWRLFVLAALALVLRIFGVRLMRYLNGMSCMHRGCDEIAERELKKIGRAELLKRTPREDDFFSGRSARR